MTMRARCTAGSPGWVPVRRPPTSTSTSTLSTLPAAAMACPSSRTLSTLSTTAMVSAACSSAARRRAIFSGPTTSVVMRMLRMPAAAITSASPTLAQQMPTAPAAIWRRAISGHLCVFEWGRSFLPAAFTCAAILAMFRSKRSRSRRRAGVGISLRVMAGRAYHGSLYARRHNLSFALYLRGLARTDSPGDGAGSCAPDAPGPCDSPPRGTRDPPASRGSPRRRRHCYIETSARATPRLAAREPSAPSFGRLSNATRGKRHRSSSADSADPSQGSPHPSSPRLLPLVREPPFFDEVLSRLEAHHQFANLRAGQPELAFFGIAPGLEPPRPLLEEDASSSPAHGPAPSSRARPRRALRPAAGAGPIQTCSG